MSGRFGSGCAALAICGVAAFTSGTDAVEAAEPPPAEVRVVDAAGTVGEFASLVLDGAGNPVVAYFDETTGDLKLAHCGDPLCDGATSPVVLDSDGGTDPSLALDASGHPVVSFYGPGRGDLEDLGALMLMRCDDPDCIGDVAVVLDDSGDLGLGSSLALDADDQYSIAYHNGTDNGFGGLAVLAFGERFHVETGDFQVGPSMSMALGSEDDVAIAYVTEPPNSGLYFARCDGPICEGRLVDPAASQLGTSVSMQLDDNGWPVIAYHDRADGDLKIARCTNGFCAPEDRSVTIDPLDPVPGLPIVISVSGWPDTCSEVELDYLDGSVAPNDAGEVLGSWGTLELDAGAGTATVIAPSQPEEYNLRVSGAVLTCGEPYYSSDFFVGFPPPPQPAGTISPMWLNSDGVLAIDVRADGWPGACPSLDVNISGPLGIANVAPTTVFVGTIQLVDGAGTLRSPASVLDGIDGWRSVDLWDVTASGPVEQCQGAYTTELGRAPVTTLPATGAARSAIPVALCALFGGMVLLAISRRRVP